ncbi:MAG: hypothetical protein QOI01_4810, partial [Mycobacterium sp.]|nr:hypothetical protein [Mycobacterium sp.]
STPTSAAMTIMDALTGDSVDLA